LPQSLTDMGSGVFANCYSLSSVTFKTTNLTVIPDGTFFGCSKLTKIIIPEGVTTIGEESFYN